MHFQYQHNSHVTDILSPLLGEDRIPFRGNSNGVWFNDCFPVKKVHVENLLTHIDKTNLSVWNEITHTEIKIFGASFNISFLLKGHHQLHIQGCIIDWDLKAATAIIYMQLLEKQLKQMMLFPAHGDMPDTIITQNMKYGGNCSIAGDLRNIPSNEFDYVVNYVNFDPVMIIVTPKPVLEQYGFPLNMYTFQSTPVTGELQNEYSKTLSRIADTNETVHLNIGAMLAAGSCVVDEEGVVKFVFRLFGKQLEAHIKCRDKWPKGYDVAQGLQFKKDRSEVIFACDEKLSNDEECVAAHYIAWLFGLINQMPTTDSWTLSFPDPGVSIGRHLLPLFVTHPDTLIESAVSNYDVCYVSTDDEGTRTLKFTSYKDWLINAKSDPNVSREDIVELGLRIAKEYEDACNDY